MSQWKALQEEWERRAAANKECDDASRLEEYERRIITGESRLSTQQRILDLMVGFKPQAEDALRKPLDEQELEALIEETERKMLGWAAPSDVDALKVRQNDDTLGLGPPMRPLDPRVLRTFILTHNRAPTRKEIEQLLAPDAPLFELAKTDK